MMVAGSHLYEPQLPSLTIIQQLVQHTSTRRVTRIGWSDNWRPESEAKEPITFIETKTKDLAYVRSVLEDVGIYEGTIPDRSMMEIVDDLTSRFDQIGFDWAK